MKKLKVGLLTSKKINFSLSGNFQLYIDRESFPVSFLNRFLNTNGIFSIDVDSFQGKELVLKPRKENDYFTIHNIIIGIDFHWEQTESQSFLGDLRIIVSQTEKASCRSLVAINEIEVEQYLQSVISSEMKGSFASEFLKAHAVISRSWVYRQIEDKDSCKSENCSTESKIMTEDEKSGHPVYKINRWYDKSDHLDFDVCADDHCQRYHGIGKIVNESALKAVHETENQVLAYNDEICDCRFSKCCGGAFEIFSSCWEQLDYPYLSSGRDIIPQEPLPDLTQEPEAEKWIKSSPKSFCNISDSTFLKRILNDFDLNTSYFYRWEISLSNNELTDLIKNKINIDLGRIIDITPLERGRSGRIIKLLIKGENSDLIIGKELEIRRLLSKSHLYSSAFTISKTYNDNQSIHDTTSGKRLVPDSFLLSGAGWGHGVGLCQIGASKMADSGFNYRQILQHYFPGAELIELKD